MSDTHAPKASEGGKKLWPFYILAIALVALGVFAIKKLWHDPSHDATGGKGTVEEQINVSTYYERKAVANEVENGNIKDGVQLANRLAPIQVREESMRAALENPYGSVCLTTRENSGTTIRMEIPKACETGFEPWVYPEGPKAKFLVTFTTADGDPLAVFPKFKAGRGSTADCNENTRICEFEGDVYYVHESSGKHRILTLRRIN